MTFLQANFFIYDGHIGEREAHSLAGVRNVYGIWALRFEEKKRRSVVEYDASRLQESDIAFMLRNAGVPLIDPASRAA